MRGGSGDVPAMVTIPASASLNIMTGDDNMNDDVFELEDNASSVMTNVPSGGLTAGTIGQPLTTTPSPTGYRDYKPPAEVLSDNYGTSSQTTGKFDNVRSALKRDQEKDDGLAHKLRSVLWQRLVSYCFVWSPKAEEESILRREHREIHEKNHGPVFSAAHLHDDRIQCLSDIGSTRSVMPSYQGQAGLLLVASQRNNDRECLRSVVAVVRPPRRFFVLPSQSSFSSLSLRGAVYLLFSLSITLPLSFLFFLVDLPRSSPSNQGLSLSFFLALPSFLFLTIFLFTGVSSLALPSDNIRRISAPPLDSSGLYSPLDGSVLYS